jgi:hypothetical protein
MPSGACRALVALLFTLVATIGLTLPVTANTDRLNEQSIVTYKVDPATGVIDVDILFTFSSAALNRPVAAGRWGPIVVEDRAVQMSVSNGFEEAGFEDLPGLWKAMYVDHDRIPAGENVSFRVQYKLNGSISQTDKRRAGTAARVDPGYVYVCVPGQDTDGGSTELRIRSSSRFDIDQSGTVLSETNRGFESDMVLNPMDLFTCVEGTRSGRLEPDEFPGPDGRTIITQAWPDLQGWLVAVENNGEQALDDIRAFLDHPIPGEGPVVVRQAPPRSIFGYASDHDTPRIVQVDENGGLEDPEHEFAHAWFGTDNITELWLREGLAEWTASSIQGVACPAVDNNDAGVELGDWKVVKPFSDPATIETDIAAQEAAACGVVTSLADRMSDEGWREVISSMLNGETKYIGSSGPGSTATTKVEYREFLDAVDERGLVPAAKADAAYAANLEDLDYAQELIRAFGADVDAVALADRSAARAEYHQFLADAAPLGAPLAVREAMDDWEFRRAMSALEKSYEVLGALRKADELLPTAGLIPFVQPGFESARNEAALDDVLSETLTLLDEAAEVFEPIGELQLATPDGWNQPLVISRAVTAKEFDLIKSAIPAAIIVVEELSAANEALPQAGLLDTYKVLYETTNSTEKLEELAGEAASVRRDAVRISLALNELERSVGEWQIPAAVTDPVNRGQISSALSIVSDAGAVVTAAREADIALPQAELSSEIRPRFEAVLTGPEMAALRADAEDNRDQAESIRGALAALESRAPDWEIPAVVETPIEARDFATAAEVSAVARAWIDSAWEANDKLPSPTAFEDAQAEFESAETIADLQDGAAKAENWNLAAARVAEAEAVYLQDRDMLSSLGLWGVDVKPTLDEAIAAAIEGDIQTAFDRSVQVIDTLNSASSSGGLRLAGIVFLGVAIVGVLGLWLMLRREAGPPWARQSTPHWVEKKPSRWRKGDDDKDK